MSGARLACAIYGKAITTPQKKVSGKETKKAFFFFLMGSTRKKFCFLASFSPISLSYAQRERAGKERGTQRERATIKRDTAEKRKRENGTTRRRALERSSRTVREKQTSTHSFPPPSTGGGFERRRQQRCAKGLARPTARELLSLAFCLSPGTPSARAKALARSRERLSPACRQRLLQSFSSFPILSTF